ncbi:MAG TPA: MFS transporter [Thermoanaerobaculia bacterium]|jgi:MFS family permease
MFEAFAERDYRRFWSTQFLSNVGSWMQAVAQGWLVYRLTDSPFLLGFVGFASSAPSIVLMLPGGVLADQLDRKRVVALSQWAQAGSALFLAISIRTNQITVWQIIGAALVVGTAQSFSAPAYQAMIIDLLDDRARLPNAVAMNSLQFNLSRAIGPLIAGAALSAWGSFWCFLANALSFLPLIFVLGRIRDRQQPAGRAFDLFARLREGFAYVRGDRVVMLLLGIVAASSLFGFPYVNLIPVLARLLFADDAAGIGYLMAASGIGALSGALLLSTMKVRRRTTIITTSLVTFGIALAAAGFLGRIGAMVMLVICGFSTVIGLALCNTMVQQRVPDEMRGRVMAMYTFAFFAFIPFGNLVAGALTEHRGISTTLLILGGGLVLSGVVALRALSSS